METLLQTQFEIKASVEPKSGAEKKFGNIAPNAAEMKPSLE